MNLYNDKTTKFSNLLFADDSRNFNFLRFDLAKLLNLIRTPEEGNDISDNIEEAKIMIRIIKEFLIKIEKDNALFYSDDKEKFCNIMQYFNELEEDVINFRK